MKTVVDKNPHWNWTRTKITTYEEWQVTFWKQQRYFSWGFFTTALLCSFTMFVSGYAFWALWYLIVGTAVLRIHITQENNFIVRRAAEVLSG